MPGKLSSLGLLRGPRGLPGATGATGAQGAEAASGAFRFSPVQNFSRGAVNDSTGNKTVGCGFIITPAAAAVVVTGVRFYWKYNQPGDVKCCLWHASDGLLASVTVTGVTTDGIYEGTFSSPYTIPSNSYSERLAVSAYDITNHERNTNVGSGDTIIGYFPAPPFSDGARFIWTRFGLNATGDANPVNEDADHRFMVEPIFQ